MDDRKPWREEAAKNTASGSGSQKAVMVKAMPRPRPKAQASQETAVPEKDTAAAGLGAIAGVPQVAGAEAVI